MFIKMWSASFFQAPVGRIFFTGEHTSEKFNGYAHGGYLSGEIYVCMLASFQATNVCGKGTNIFLPKNKC